MAAAGPDNPSVLGFFDVRLNVVGGIGLGVDTRLGVDVELGVAGRRGLSLHVCRGVGVGIGGSIGGSVGRSIGGSVGGSIHRC